MEPIRTTCPCKLSVNDRVCGSSSATQVSPAPLVIGIKTKAIFFKKCIYFITLTGVIMFKYFISFISLPCAFSASWIISGVSQRPFLSDRGIVWMIITKISLVNTYEQQMEYSITVNVPQTWQRRAPYKQWTRKGGILSLVQSTRTWVYAHMWCIGPTRYAQLWLEQTARLLWNNTLSVVRL